MSDFQIRAADAETGETDCAAAQDRRVEVETGKEHAGRRRERGYAGRRRRGRRIGDRQERRAGGAGRRRRGQQCDGDGGRAGERRGADLYLKEHNDGAVGSVFPLFPETQGALLLYFLHGNPRQAF